MSESTSVMPGGWTSFNSPLTAKATSVFEAAQKQLLGVKYTPFAFAEQLVAGTNYCFLCTAHVVGPVQNGFAAEVSVYVPLKGDPHVTGIKRLMPGH